MTVARLVARLRARGIRLRLDEHGTLLVRGMTRLTAREREALRRHRDAVAEFLREPEEALEKEEPTETDAEGARLEGHRGAKPTGRVRSGTLTSRDRLRAWLAFLAEGPQAERPTDANARAAAIFFSRWRDTPLGHLGMAVEAARAPEPEVDAFERSNRFR